MRTLALGRIAALTRPAIILCNSPYATNLLRYVAADQSLPVVAGCYIHAIPSNASFDQVVLVYAAGRAEELSFYGQLTGKLANSLTGVTVRCLSAECPENCPPELWVFHWPGIECLPATNVVVGGAGYNTFSECVAVGVPLVAFAFPRRYDRQRMRVRRWCDRQQWPPVRLVESVEEALLAVSDCLQLLPCHQPNFINGTIASVHSIEKVIRA